MGKRRGTGKISGLAGVQKVAADYSLYRAQVEFLARQTPITILVNGGVTIFTAVILWNSVPDTWLFAWIISQLSFVILCSLLWRRGINRSRGTSASAGLRRQKAGGRRITPATIWGAIGGFSWGATSIFLPHLTPGEQVALIIVLFGMSSGASSSLAAIPAAAASFIITTLSPMTAYFFLQGTWVYAALGIMAVIYTMALLYSTRTIYQTFLEAQQNRQQNAALLDQIREERNAASESLLRSEQRYSDIVETVGDMIVITNGEGEFIFVNTAWRETLGYLNADLPAMTFRGTLHEDYLPQSIERIRSVLALETDSAIELVLKTKGGQPVWVEGKVTPLIENGELVRINGVFRDIGLRKKAEQAQQEMQQQLEQRVAEATRNLETINISLQQQVAVRLQAEQAWRNSEEQLRLILDSTVEAIYGVDTSGRCTFANTACAAALGFEEPAELLGVDMHNLAHKQSEEVPAQDCPICIVNTSRARGHSDEQFFLRKDGSAFPVEYSTGSILRDGAVVGGVVAFFDISRRRQAEEQLRQSQKMETIGQLTGGIAHDFNNLLAVIVGNLDLLAAGMQENAAPAGAAIKRRTQAALKAAERAAALTQRLLTFSRQKTLSPQIICPAVMAEEMSEMLRRVLGESISIDIQVATPLWAANIDPPQFENALLNLAINARDAMSGQGTLTIEISNISLDAPLPLARRQLPPGDYIKLTVSDTGIGMQPGILDKVFEPFFTTKDIGHGTGLGLSMVSTFVEQSNGAIHIDSAPGQGAQVHIYLPRAMPASPLVPDNENIPVGDTASVSVAAPFQPQHISILVVEDDQGVRQSSATQISEMGYNVLVAEDGHSALAVFRENPDIDLVYTDIMMPKGLSGPQLAGHLRELNPRVKLLFCTGFAGEMVQAMDPGDAALVLQKPVRKAVLAVKLREVLGA